MAFYWVNLGDSHKEVAKYSFLWAPTYTISGKGTKSVNAGWKHVSDVSKGDIIFCHANGEIIYVAIATKDPYLSQRPPNRTYDKWKKEGNKIEVDLEVLATPVSNKEFKDEFIPLFNSQTSPKLFTVKREPSQQYMVSIPDGAGALILNALGDASINIQDKLNTSKGKQKPQETTRDSWVKSRIGQGQFRDDVLALWNSTCPITKVDIPGLLIASHIVSWQLSNDQEKLDKFNGLPLSPDVDKLFDKGFISFSDEGEILIHKSISTTLLDQLGIDQSKRIESLKADNLPYLKRHRELYGF